MGNDWRSQGKTNRVSRKVINMTKTLLDLSEIESNYTKTENGAITHKSTLDNVLDFFSLGAAMRERSENDIINIFSKAFHEDQGLALKCAFYFRDIREGQGERRLFRTILNYLGNTYPEIIKKNFDHIAEFGRWDDFYAFVGTKIEKDAFLFLKKQFLADMESEHPSLLAKWLKSNNPKSSKKFHEMYHKTREHFEMTSMQYRKAVASVRKKIKIVESKMCAKQWKEINYEQVPSQASSKYAKAFKKNDNQRYTEYLNDVAQGTKKIHADALYPYEILRNTLKSPENIDTYDSQWKSLPNWVNDENSIVVCDTSGSMTSNNMLPLLCSVSIAMYCGERNKGIFHNKFITFSTNPSIQTIVGANLLDKFNNLSKADWMGNTDLEAVFNLLLKTAKKYNIPQEEMPSRIYIISDMEFDACTINRDSTNFETMKMLYKEHGYKMPYIIFWNVNARRNHAPIVIGDTMVYLVSGSSPSSFKSLMESKSNNAIDYMLEVLNKSRYQSIQI